MAHLISKSGVSADQQKVRAVKYWPRPKKQMTRSIVFRTGELLQKINLSQPGNFLTIDRFDEECLIAMYSSSGISIFWTNRVFYEGSYLSNVWSQERSIVTSDASRFAIGAVFAKNQDGRFHQFRYASRTLNNADQNYAANERVLLAVVDTIRGWRVYLRGIITTAYTEH